MLARTLKITVLVCAGAQVSQAQDACSIYTIQAGDSLSSIARSAYGSIAFQDIWDANRTVIGSNPNLISIGKELRLPCADGSLPSSIAPATAADASPAPAETAAAPDQALTITLVTGSDFAPFTDENLQGGGIYTQLVRSAMEAVEPKAVTSISFINDWGAHLDTLVPTNAFDGTFPWIQPDCDDLSKLTEGTAKRCENFVFSDPFYEIIDSLVVWEDTPLATTSAVTDFHGTTICLPQDYTDAPLANLGLVAPKITLVSPATPKDCITQLNEGKVDAVQLEQRQAQDVISDLGLDGKFAINPHVNNISLLTVYVGKNNPDADEIIALLNEGLEVIRNNGVWFETVRSGFAEFYAD